MVDTITTIYVSGITVLFFFWVYGIYAFLRDFQRTYAPKACQIVRGWQLIRTEEAEEEFDEHERQLL